MNEPQVWTLIGVFSAAMVGILGLVYFSIKNLGDSLRAEMAGFRNEMITRFDHLDRDVNFLMRKEFGER